MATWLLDPAVIHLNHGSFGACPVEVLELQTALRAEMEANPVSFMLEHYQPALEASRAALAEFVGADPEEMYERIQVIRGVRQDPCVLYVYRCAVYYASTPVPKPELLEWWAWKGRTLDGPE